MTLNVFIGHYEFKAVKASKLSDSAHVAMAPWGGYD